MGEIRESKCLALMLNQSHLSGEGEINYLGGGKGGEQRKMAQHDKNSSPFTKEAETSVWGWKLYQGTFLLGGITGARTASVG